ncbi:pyridoxine/pyridoxamine 5'-phosphate oxidase [Elizabethkingia miricola]|uniref:pyridoxine/pyridoxamine 5'-phosphate oxidase n=1 Tax=Elizabethkingia miricola TaxID=172045 RepID=UPI000B35F380|nr:pyridoxal 5'-phosphate synthase [Elizabethkingia miricola]NHQ66817.1 pyridoxamine 5'-phosphate oxidase [Elizabethkingia miricola]NHQ70505.1 pyridoxamine 5'-phosphate oxidase [Elizabethkingia miricola]NHQ77315.1 pyridoxamine 5'-phosphate oxidase [Elizabethkingia miricola]PSL88108.1 pyridoxamine 5'-phosphate oxidase [Elizabethkingia miricola]QHQ85941.1 pyridoxamine 5'-phosphate oxidase [Elizabethkingia miricola]
MIVETGFDEIISLFNNGLEREMQVHKQKLPYACCLSTEGLNGFPNARFVSLKEIRNEEFVVTGTLTSRKGEEINHNNKVALTFWWPETQQQVRIQGEARLISGLVLDSYFNERNRESQIVSVVSDQGKELHDLNELILKFDAVANNTEISEIRRPDNWGGYAIVPFRIEFLVFSESRFHDRTLYERKDQIWQKKKIQP